MSLKADVFEFQNRGEHTLSQRAYLGLLSALVAGGLVLAAYVASLTYTMVPNGWWIVGYFAVTLPGIYLSAQHGWFLSLIGYVMVIVPTGAITGPYAHLYQLDSVVNVALITVILTILIGTMGVVYPKSVEHWGGFLFFTLLAAVVLDFGRVLLQIGGFDAGGFVWWHGAVALLFAAYIFYDMNQAAREDYTVDNAVDRAVALYLDILNLFLRLLSILGKKK